MTLKILGTGLLAATMFAAPGLVSAKTSTRSTECADKTGSVASLTRDDWVAWTKEQKDHAAKPAGTEAANEAAKPTAKELAEQYQKLLRQEKAEATESERRQQSAARDTSATTGSAAPADRATDGADDPEAEANIPKANADGSERYSAPSGGYSSGAHIGNESPTDSGNSAGGMEESKSAERMTRKDC
jgi:hypothetical protein